MSKEMFFLSYKVGCSLCFALCIGSHISSCDSYVNSESVEDTRGTFYENGGASCDESWTTNSLEGASSYTKLFLLPRDLHKNHSEIIYGNMTSLLESGFNINKATKLMVHGWLEYGFDGFVMSLTESYFEALGEDVNILTVDWSKVADKLYPIARFYVDPVGKFMAEFVDWLVSEAGVSLDNLHIIGLSLGAHVAGVMGEKVTVGKIGRITGLDPAGPMFSHSTSGRLDSSDAKFVDIIHTCGHWAGYFKASGHVDFYPNGGEFNQPGCNPLDLGVCSHKRSYHLFNESISDLRFFSRECDSWDNFVRGNCDGNNSTVMGEHVDKRTRGTFYLLTTGSYPFAIGNFKPSK